MSHNLSLLDLQKSIEKVNTIVDVHVNQINDSFLVDNFVPKIFLEILF